MCISGNVREVRKACGYMRGGYIGSVVGVVSAASVVRVECMVRVERVVGVLCMIKMAYERWMSYK